LEDIEKTRQEALEMLKTIQTLDDFKSRKDEILDFLEEMLKTGLMALKEFMSNMMGMSEDERMVNMEKLEGQTDLFGPEIEAELDRIISIPGAEEFSESFQGEMEARLGPFMEDMAQSLMGGMADMMGGMMDATGEAMGGMIEGIEEGYDWESNITTVFEDPSRERLTAIYSIYDINKPEDFEEMKKFIFETWEERTAELKENLQIPFEMEIKLNSDDYTRKEVEKLMVKLPVEFEMEMMRISRIPDSEVHVQEIRDYYNQKMMPAIGELAAMLNRVKE
jgi:hypothetical protein